MVFDFETMFADGIPDGGRQLPLRRGKYDFDVTGHYARPDVFELIVDTRAKPAVRKV